MPFYRSIFFRLNLFFILALLTLGLFFGLFRLTTAHMEKQREGMRGMELGRLLHHTRSDSAGQRRAELDAAQFTLLAPAAFPADAERIPPPRRMRSEMKKRPEPPFALYEHGGSYYFRSLPPNDALVIRDDRPGEDFTGVKTLFVLLFAGLAGLYLLLRRSLLPLRELHGHIRRFAGGALDIDTSSTQNDEIAAIANEFNEAVSQLRKLRDSRRLFLRNVMHELKTPLTRGKLALALMEETEQRGYLDRLFNRMDELIDRIAQIEKLRSIAPDRREHRLGDLVASAVEQLYLDRPRRELLQIALDSDITLNVDAPLFESALTNLLDNALKYADALPVSVVADRESLCISNRGAPLQTEIGTLLQPFSGSGTSGGLGLGLFIADTVIRAHGFALTYGYTGGTHRFCIVFAPAGSGAPRAIRAVRPG